MRRFSHDEVLRICSLVQTQSLRNLTFKSGDMELLESVGYKIINQSLVFPYKLARAAGERFELKSGFKLAMAKRETKQVKQNLEIDVIISHPKGMTEKLKQQIEDKLTEVAEELGCEVSGSFTLEDEV